MKLPGPDPVANYRHFQARLREICHACGRDLNEVTVVAVSKNAAPDAALAIARAGARDLGENRVQALLARQAAFTQAGCAVRWHLIGTLQTNKARQIVGKTVLIHSLDRPSLAVELGKRSKAAGIVTDVLMQFNLAQEEQKHGFAAAQARQALAHCVSIPGIAVRGIMVMAPLAGGRDAARRTFADARDLFERLRADGQVEPRHFCDLSMGMSGDYAEAIQAGATIIRVGSVLFGPPANISPG